MSVALWGGLPTCGDAGDLVVSQVYGGGGNSGAVYRNDFIELFNRGANSVILSNWSIQYASATGSNWQVTVLDGCVPPGGYLLIQQASSGANGIPLPAPDVVATVAMSSSAGKVALVRSIAPLSGPCPNRADLLDLVGYGATASCFEGAAPASAPGNAAAVFRASGGCVDLDHNGNDFFASSPSPRTSQAVPQPCSSLPTGPMALHAIQGVASISPFVGQRVLTTTNIVTAWRNNGFFLQARDVEADHAPGTSEAIFVFTTTAPSATAGIGNAVVVEGIVEERHPANDANGLSRTQLINPLVTFISSGNALPAPVIVSTTSANPSGTPDQLEPLEAMRVHVASLTVVAPTDGFLIESNAAAISDGVFFGVVTGVPRPFREPGISLFDDVPLAAPQSISRFDTNPERLRVDSNAQAGAGRIEVTAGAVVSNLTGVLDFESRHYTILPDANAGVSVIGNRSAVPVTVTAAEEITVAALNLQRFYDTLDDPVTDDVVLTTNAFEARLDKVSRVIRHVLRAPDVLGVEEIENLPTLQAIAARVNSDALAAGGIRPDYAAYVFEGNDVGGIDVGFLVRTARVSVLEIVQLGRTNTYWDPTGGGKQGLLHDRPPLLLRATVARAGDAVPFPFTTILVHFRSLLGISDPIDGPRVRAKRRAQAEFLATVIQERQTADPREHLLCLGDFNAHGFNDGYVDVLGTIRGQPAPSNEVTLASADLVNPDLVNLIDDLPPDERYSFINDGNAQALDHVLVNAPLRPHAVRFAFARCGADFPESYRSSANRPERLSDHDAPVVFLNVAPVLRLTSIARTDLHEVQLEWISEPQGESVVEASATLSDWTEIARVTAERDGRARCTDAGARHFGQRFYRLRSL